MRISDWSSDVCSSDLSTGEVRSDPLKLSNMPRSNGSTGSTTGGCSSLSETSRPLKPKNDITPCWTTSPWLRNLCQMASGSPAALHFIFDGVYDHAFDKRF